MFKDELLQDIKALAGIPIFLLFIISSSILGQKLLSVQLILGLALSYALTILIRATFFQQRPDKQKYAGFVTKIDAASFPSLHGMRAGVLATILSLNFSNSVLTGLFAFAAVAVAVVRVIQKRHYPRDVVAGLLLGVMIGFAAVRIAG